MLSAFDFRVANFFVTSDVSIQPGKEVGGIFCLVYDWGRGDHKQKCLTHLESPVRTSCLTEKLAFQRTIFSNPY